MGAFVQTNSFQQITFVRLLGILRKVVQPDYSGALRTAEALDQAIDDEGKRPKIPVGQQKGARQASCHRSRRRDTEEESPPGRRHPYHPLSMSRFR